MLKKMKRLRAFSHGLTICYIGNGKGKTTAAIGLAVRARGYGKRVLFLQFMKSPEWPSGERASLQKLGITVRVMGRGFVGIWGDKKPRKEHVHAARRALAYAGKEIQKGVHDVVVLDELISCIEADLLAQKDVLALLAEFRKKGKNSATHLVLTGHKKYPKIVARCDLVTYMKAVKHPFSLGFLAVKAVDY